ncbi:MAG: hypothetical protein JSW03_07700 [Candidatus Eiseniibacteriota bacterium]|nr:MAG: hypothetical protein JSW03_07700 [Candidatus Eisenbacteria bacterium]
MRRTVVRGPTRAAKFLGLALVGLWLMLACAGLVHSGCARRQDSGGEEKAVIALLEEESRLAIAGSIDSLLSLYVQDDKNARLSVTKNASAMITGWASIREHQVNLLKSSWMGWQDKKFRKENVWVKVNGDNAWAVCDNIWQWREGEQRKQFQNIQITFCEKQGGRWKIAFQAFVRDPEHLDVIDIE